LSPPNIPPTAFARSLLWRVDERMLTLAPDPPPLVVRTIA
jgi:hypothetical protein